MSWFLFILAASPLLCPGMRPVLFHQLRIHVHRAYIPMPQHLLDRMDIRAVFQQVRGEGMAESVWGDILLDARHLLIVLYDLPESLTGHVLATYVHEEGLFVRS